MKQSSDPKNVALDLLPCGVAVADAAGRLVVANEAARVLLGLEGQDLDQVMLHYEGQPIRLGELIRDHVAGATLRQRLQLEHQEHGWLRATLSLAEEEGGPMVHLTLEPGPRRDWRWVGRSDPLSAIGHELRNAVTSLHEGLDLLGEDRLGRLSEPQKRLLSGAKRDAGRMMRLTENMLAARGSRAGAVRIAATRVDVPEFMRGVATSFEAAAAKTGVQLALDEMSEPTACHGDVNLLTQAVGNLVVNALKFTPSGESIRLGARRFEDESGEEFVELSVKDTGPGIPANEVKRILEGSSGPHSSTPSEEGKGLGMGLLIVREIIEQHGGHMSVESEVGVGTCFRLAIPVDFRRSKHWRLAQIAGAIKLARVVRVPLSIVEMRLIAMKDTVEPWAAEKGMLQLPLVEQCLVDSLRPSDAVLVSEASAMLVLHDTDEQGARLVAERAIDVLARLFSGLAEPCPSSAIVFGIATYPSGGTSPTELVATARQDLWKKPAAQALLGPYEESHSPEL